MEKEFKGLQGLKVIELGQVVAGPFCGSMLADFGADVIKVEEPKNGDALRLMSKIKELSFAVENRNKKSITLNLKDPKAKEILTTLIKDADIVIQNFRVGVLEKLGFGWEEIQKINKRTILVSISGFGQDGPYADRPGYDSVGLAMGGLTYITGSPESGPVRAGSVIADYATGLFAAYGALVAVYNRDVLGTGVGQHIDACLYESVLRFMESNIAEYGYNGNIKQRFGNGHPLTAPSGIFETKDNKYVTISVGNNKLFASFAKCIGKEEIINDEKYATQAARLKIRDEICDMTADWFKQYTLAECMEIFGTAVPLGPIYDMKDIFEDPHFQYRQAIAKIQDPRFGELCVQNVVPRLSGTPGKITSAAPGLGEHNVEIYTKALGITAEEVAKLKEEGVI